MTSITRLHSVAPDLVEFGEDLPANDRLAIARLAAKWACQQTDTMRLFGEDRVTTLFSEARVITEQDRELLAREVEAMDEKYFSLSEQEDVIENSAAALQWFSKARAAASLLCSFDADTLAGFCETVYEAQAATDNLEALRTLLYK